MPIISDPTIRDQPEHSKFLLLVDRRLKEELPQPHIDPRGQYIYDITMTNARKYAEKGNVNPKNMEDKAEEFVFNAKQDLFDNKLQRAADEFAIQGNQFRYRKVKQRSRTPSPSKDDSPKSKCPGCSMMGGRSYKYRNMRKSSRNMRKSRRKSRK